MSHWFFSLRDVMWAVIALIPPVGFILAGAFDRNGDRELYPHAWIFMFYLALVTYVALLVTLYFGVLR